MSRLAWVVPGNLPRTISGVPVRLEENRDGRMGGYHGWSQIRVGESVALIPGQVQGVGQNVWHLVEYKTRRFWVAEVNLREVL